MDIPKCKRLVCAMQLMMAAQEEINSIPEPDKYADIIKLLNEACELARKYMD